MARETELRRLGRCVQDGTRVHVDFKQAFLKTRSSGTHLTGGIERKGSPLKHHFILTAHQMGVDQGQSGLRNPLGHHRFALSAFAGMKGRGIEHHQEFGAQDGALRGRALKPSVLTQQEPHLQAAHLKETRLMSFGEIASLIKDLVIGQLLLVVMRDNLAITQHTRAVDTRRHAH